MFSTLIASSLSWLFCLIDEQHSEFFDALFFLHGTLYRKRLVCRQYDVPTAIDVLASGTYPRLPTSVYLLSLFNMLLFTVITAQNHRKLSP